MRQMTDGSITRTLDRDVGDMEYRIISPSFTWRPTENLEIYYRYDDTTQDQDANTLLNMAQPDQAFCFYYDQCAKSLTVPQSGDRYTVLQNDDPPYQTYFDTRPISSMRHGTSITATTWRLCLEIFRPMKRFTRTGMQLQ